MYHFDLWLIPSFWPGNGDILSYEDANRAMQMGVSGVMIARQVPVFPLCF